MTNRVQDAFDCIKADKDLKAGYSWVQRPVSYVSIDVNPSIELALNRFDRVVYAAAYNLEGEEILNGLSLKGKK